MQAYEGYIDGGRFFPLGAQVGIIGLHRAILTVLDEPTVEPKKLGHTEYLSVLDELCGSIDDPTFSEPPEIPLELNAPREELK